MKGILFCGDLMPGGVLPYQEDYMSKAVQEYLDSFDLRIGTLEAAIGTGLAYDEIKMQGRANIVYARNEDFYRIKEMGFNVVSLANNHVGDLGDEGLKNTIKLLREAGIQYCGAGMNIEEASKPAIIEYNGKTMAILAYCMYGNKYLGYVELAGVDKAGVNPLDIDKVVDDITQLKKKYDYVVVMPHWGREYQYFPMLECKTMAYRMIDAGADLIVGSHAHNIQPVIKYRSKYIYFGLGNFLFPDFYMHPPRPIWYPEKSEDLSCVERIIGYPFPIEKPSVTVWNGLSRIGMSVRLQIGKSGKLKTDYILTYLSINNIVYMFPCLRTLLKKSRLWWMGRAISSKYYEFWLRVYYSRFNILRRAKHWVCRKLNISNEIAV